MIIEEELKKYRKELDEITDELIELIAKRKEIVLKIKKIKRKKGIGVIDVKRHEEMFYKALNKAKEKKVKKEVVEKILWILIAYAIEIQEEE